MNEFMSSAAWGGRITGWQTLRRARVPANLSSFLRVISDHHSPAACLTLTSSDTLIPFSVTKSRSKEKGNSASKLLMGRKQHSGARHHPHFPFFQLLFLSHFPSTNSLWFNVTTARGQSCFNNESYFISLMNAGENFDTSYNIPFDLSRICKMYFVNINYLSLIINGGTLLWFPNNVKTSKPKGKFPLLRMWLSRVWRRVA